MRRPPTNRFVWVIAVCLAAVPALLGVAPAAPFSQPRPNLEDLTGELDRVLPERMRRSNTPGAAVAVVQAGELVWSRGYGLADLSSGRPVGDGSLFGVASISKTVTAWGVLALVEAGKINLDAPVEQYLTRWRFPPSAYDSGGVTIRRLLSHTAGLNTPEYLGYPPGQPLPSIETVLTDGDGRTPGVRIVRTPGDKFAYSDGGYLLLQLLIEEVSGQPFAAYMQRTILDPLGLPGATFRVPPSQTTRIVASYDSNLAPYPLYNFVELAPAGLYITAPDLARFVAAMLPGPGGAPPGRAVLAPATIDLMMKPQAILRFPENLIYARSYGLGLFIDPFPGDGSLVSHMGGNLNGVTEFMARPASGDTIIVLTTGSSGHEVFGDALAIWTAWLGSPPATLPRAIQAARRILAVVAAALGWAGLLLCATLLAQLRHGRRRIRLRCDPRPAWLRLVLALAPLAAMGLYLACLHPLLQYAMPSVAGAMAFGIAGLLLAALAWGLSAKTAGNQPAAGSPIELTA